MSPVEMSSSAMADAKEFRANTNSKAKLASPCTPAPPCKQPPRPPPVPCRPTPPCSCSRPDCRRTEEVVKERIKRG